MQEWGWGWVHVRNQCVSVGSGVLCLLRGCLCQAAWSTSWAPRPLGSYITAYIAVLHVRRTTYTPTVPAVCVNSQDSLLAFIASDLYLCLFVYAHTRHSFTQQIKSATLQGCNWRAAEVLCFTTTWVSVPGSSSSHIAACAFGLCSATSAPRDGLILPIKGEVGRQWEGGTPM